MKDDQVVDAFTDANELHRNAEIALDRNHDAPAGRAVELGEHDASHARRRQELSSLAERILAGRRIEDQQRLKHLARFAVRDPTYFRELVEKIGAVGPSTRGVGEHNIDAASG